MQVEKKAKVNWTGGLSVVLSGVLALLPLIGIFLAPQLLSLTGCEIKVETEIENCQGFARWAASQLLAVSLFSLFLGIPYLLISIPAWFFYIVRRGKRRNGGTNS